MDKKKEKYSKTLIKIFVKRSKENFSENFSKKPVFGFFKTTV
jgi:hypothetical protein